MFNLKKEIILVRGIPGSGKSSLALSLVNGDKRRLVENDDFWYVPKSDAHFPGSYSEFIDMGPHLHKVLQGFEYQYHMEMTHIAGSWCGAEAFRRLFIFDKVAVANTFVKRIHIIPYIEEARKLQIKVILLEAKTDWAKDVDECFEKNVHRVPLEVIERMAKDWEEMTQLEVDILLNLPVQFRG